MKTSSPQVILCSSFASLALLAVAQEPDAASKGDSAPAKMDEIVVTGKRSDLLGIAPSASEGTASGEELRARPLMRRGEALETVPGMVVTQHAGGGKANQYFLRGFNLDHGTDFALTLDGMPLNMRTHAHGQGYADLNLLLPELLERVDYFKGTYTARNGDLSSAGSADFHLYNVLPNNFVTAEFGEYGYYRAAAGNTFNTSTGPDSGKLTLAGEYNHYDGPWQLPENFNRWNGFSRYFKGDSDDHIALTLMGYHGKWRSSDQIPLRAVESGEVDRFGNLNPTNGGTSSRYSLQLNLQNRDADGTTKLNLYAVRYSLDLFSDFTYSINRPEGDQFEQAETRYILGGNLSRKWEGLHWFGRDSDFTLGLQARTDLIDGIGLYNTQDRVRWKTVREDDVHQSSIGVFAENTVHWFPWLKTITGVRADGFLFDGNADRPGNSGGEMAGIISPKFTAVFGPWDKTEYYVNFGTGFHSNDARGVNTTIDPSSGAAVSRVPALVRTVGGELGLRTQLIPKATAVLSLWYLQSESELVYVGDAGTNDPGPASRRFGVEAATYWNPVDWLGVDAEIAVSHGRLEDSPDGKFIPNSIPWMFSGGFVLGAQGQQTGWFTGTRARLFGKRTLNEDGSARGRQTVMVNANVGYRTPRWEGVLECLNILNRRDRDIEYFYESRMQSENDPVEGIHFHPVEPRMFRARVTYKF
jgi:hypothetical protein